MRRVPIPDIMQTRYGPALVSAMTDGPGRLRRFEIAFFDEMANRTLPPHLLGVPGDIPESLRGSRLGMWSAAAYDDVAAIVFQAETAFGLALLDLPAKQVSSVRPLELALPAERGKYVHARVAAAPDRFGAAVAISDALVWLEFDRLGKILNEPSLLQTVSLPDPVAVWNGQNFAFMSRRLLDGKEWLGIVEMARDGSSRFLGAVIEDRADRTYYPEGRLVWHEGAYIFGARSFGLERTANGSARFELFRVERTGHVARRECPDHS